jgi:FAD/FMN-containing dehydrogenase
LWKRRIKRDPADIDGVTSLIGGNVATNAGGMRAVK